MSIDELIARERRAWERFNRLAALLSALLMATAGIAFALLAWILMGAR